MATAGKLSEHRALRLIMTGTAGTRKSRTVHGIAELRQRTVREACLRRGVPVDEEAVRSASVLVAPTGTASFQMKYGATTMHRAFSLGFNSFCGPQQTRATPAFLKRMSRLRAASLTVMDEFSMIGRIMMGKVCFKANDLLGSDQAGAGKLASMGGRMTFWQEIQIKHSRSRMSLGTRRERTRRREGTSQRIRRIDIRMPCLVAWATAELVGIGVTFRKEFDDVVLLAQQRRPVNPAEEKVLDEQREAYVADAARFREVTYRMRDLTWIEKDHEWLAKCNRSALLRLPRGAAEVAKFMDAPLLMDTRKQRVKRGGDDVKNMDGADLNNLEELMKLARRTGEPAVRFQSFHKKRAVDVILKARSLDDDDFGLANELCLCNDVWPMGGDPNSTTSSKRAPICVIVEFDDVQPGGRRLFVRSMMFCQGRSHSSCFSGVVALQTLVACAPPCLQQQLFHSREVYALQEAHRATRAT